MHGRITLTYSVSAVDSRAVRITPSAKWHATTASNVSGIGSEPSRRYVSQSSWEHGGWRDNGFGSILVVCSRRR